MVELQARFDEQANIAWARALEEAGVQVVYGLATPEDPRQDLAWWSAARGTTIRRYCHVGHRQLQLGDGARPTRTSDCSPPTPTSGPTSASCSTC